MPTPSPTLPTTALPMPRPLLELLGLPHCAERETGRGTAQCCTVLYHDTALDWTALTASALYGVRCP